MYEREHLSLRRISEYSCRGPVRAQRRARSGVMTPFTFAKARTEREALDLVLQPNTVFIAGGTTLLDLMKLNVHTPAKLVDINALPLDKIEVQTNGSLLVGAMVRNSDLAWHQHV